MNYNNDIRMDVNIHDNKKYHRLRKAVGIGAMDILTRLWCVTAKVCPDGFLKGFTPEDVEALVGWDGAPGFLVKTLVQAGWLDLAEGGYLIHEWAEHQPYVAGAPTRVEAGRKGGKASGAARRQAAIESLEPDGQSQEPKPLNEAKAPALPPSPERGPLTEPTSLNERLPNGIERMPNPLTLTLPLTLASSLEERSNPEEVRLKHNQPSPARARVGPVGGAHPALGILKENLPRMSRADMVEAENACEKYPARWIEAAVEEASVQNRRNWRYVRAILTRWERERDGPPVDAEGTLRAAAPPNGEGGTE